MSDPAFRVDNLLTLARAAVHRDDVVALYARAQVVCIETFSKLRVERSLGLQIQRPSGGHLVAFDHRNITWTFYTSRWYWRAANHYRMGVRDIRNIDGCAVTGVWLTKDMAARANAYTTRGKARGEPEPKDKPWEEWWQGFKGVHRDIRTLLDRIATTDRTSGALIWGDVYGLLERCRLAAERGPTWPGVRSKAAPEPEVKPRPLSPAVPVKKMVKKGHPNRVCADGVERWRFARSYRRAGERLGLGELDPDGYHIWLAEGHEQMAVATHVKSKNIGMDIRTS